MSHGLEKEFAEWMSFNHVDTVPSTQGLDDDIAMKNTCSDCEDFAENFEKEMMNEFIGSIRSLTEAYSENHHECTREREKLAEKSAHILKSMLKQVRLEQANLEALNLLRRHLPAYIPLFREHVRITESKHDHVSIGSDLTVGTHKKEMKFKHVTFSFHLEEYQSDSVKQNHYPDEHVEIGSNVHKRLFSYSGSSFVDEVKPNNSSFNRQAMESLRSELGFDGNLQLFSLFLVLCLFPDEYDVQEAAFMQALVNNFRINTH